MIEANALILAPSDWIVPVLTERLNISYDHIKVWAAGIDHEKWNSNRFPRQNTIIYLKSNTTQELSVIKEYLTSINRNCIIMKYGYYTEREFRKNLEISDSAIWLGETESQGIALLESWSMGVPTLVRKRSTYFDPIVKRNFEASAAPYLDSTCGQFSEYDSIQISDMFSFFSTIDQRDPRKFVIENFTNEIAVKKLISIIL